MYIQWGTLDNEGERFRGKDAAGMVSGMSCLDYLDLTCCRRQTFVELEAVRMNAVNDFLDNEKMQPKIDTPEVQMHASTVNVCIDEEKLIDEVQKSAFPKRDQQRHRTAHVKAIK